MNTDLKIPDGDGGEKVTPLKMSDIYFAMTRIEEIAIINTQKAPELIACFTRAYASLTDHLAVVSAEVVKAQNAVGKRTAIVTLDEAPRILREKGLISSRSPGGSEDLRRSVLEMDEPYLKSRDRLQELEAYYELLEGKQDSIERAYLAVRKIVGGDRFEFKNPNLGSSFPGRRDEESSGGVGRNYPTQVPVPRAEPIIPKKTEPDNPLRAQFSNPQD